ncbi:MAG: DUF6988 family protein [Pseudomonadota bacterium]
MTLDEELRRSAEWLSFVNSVVSEFQTTTTLRRRVALGFLHLGLEHYSAILTLFKTNHPGSALALVRPQFEAFIRGTWYWHRASEEQIRAFISDGKLPPKIGVLLDDLDNFHGYAPSNLKDVKKNAWEIMNDYTHGGAFQITSRNSLENIECSYPEKQRAGAMQTSTIISLLQSLVLAEVVNDVDASQKLIATHKQIFDVSP